MNTFESVFIVTGCVSFSVFASLVGIAVGIISSAVKIKFFVITALIKMYEPLNKKKKHKHDKIVLLAKSKLSSIEVYLNSSSFNKF